MKPVMILFLSQSILNISDIFSVSLSAVSIRTRICMLFFSSFLLCLNYSKYTSCCCCCQAISFFFSNALNGSPNIFVFCGPRPYIAHALLTIAISSGVKISAILIIPVNPFLSLRLDCFLFVFLKYFVNTRIDFTVTISSHSILILCDYDFIILM